MKRAVRRPVLRYHGGKFRLAPWIISHFPPHRVYVEPYGGAGSVLLTKPRSFAEVYNDIDDEVVNVFQVMRDPRKAAQLKAALDLTPFARREFERAYQPAKAPVERARRTIIKAFLGRRSGSIWDRTPARAAFASKRHNPSTPTGFRSHSWAHHKAAPSDWLTYPECLASFTTRLNGVVIECREAADVLVTHDRVDTLHFIDPPYVRSTRDHKAAYGHEMTDAQHRMLSVVLHGLKGMVVLCGYASPLYSELFADWETVTKETRAGDASLRTEVLWLSPTCSKALRASRSQLEIVA